MLQREPGIKKKADSKENAESFTSDRKIKWQIYGGKMKEGKGNWICDCGNEWNPVYHEGKCPDCGRIFERKNNEWHLKSPPKPKTSTEESDITGIATQSLSQAETQSLSQPKTQSKEKERKELIRQIKEVLEEEESSALTMFGRLKNVLSKEEESE